MCRPTIIRIFVALIGFMLWNCQSPSSESGDSIVSNDKDSIAISAGHSDFDTLDEASIIDRSYWQKPALVVESLGDISDKVIVDLGAGTGYFTLRLLPTAKKIIAVDIDSRMTLFIERLKADLKKEYSDKLEVRLAEAADPKIGQGEADIIFISNTYTFIENRVPYFRELQNALKADGKVVIVDFKKKRIPLEIDPEDRMALYEVEQELIDAGYSIENSDDQSLPYQYIIEAVIKRR